MCAQNVSSTGDEESATAAAAAPHVAAVLLGIKLLVASFAASPGMRESLLREVQGKLVGVKEEVALPFVAVLGILVHRHPKAVLQHANLLKVGLCCWMRTIPLSCTVDVAACARKIISRRLCILNTHPRQDCSTQNACAHSYHRARLPHQDAQMNQRLRANVCLSYVETCTSIHLDVLAGSPG